MRKIVTRTVLSLSLIRLVTPKPEITFCVLTPINWRLLDAFN